MSVIKEKQLPDISISKITGLQGELNNKATIGNDGKVIPEQLPASFSGEGIGIDGFYRNAIINGNFDIWQRGISFTAMGYAADRWRIHGIGSTKTYSRQAFSVGQTEVPNNPTYFARIEVASVVGTGNYVLSVQRIENVTKLSGKTITVSFWAKSDAVKNICVEFTQNIGGSGFNTISPTTMTLSTTWKKYTVTTTLPSLAGKTINANNFTELVFWFDAGSDFNSRSNSLGQQSGTFDIAQVQLNEGETALPFLTRTFSEELSLCQRYYEKSYATNTAPGTITSVGTHLAPAFSTYDLNGGMLIFKVTKRVTPVGTLYNAGTGVANNISDSNNANPTAASVADASENSMRAFGVGTLTSGRVYRFHWVADAEL